MNSAVAAHHTAPIRGPPTGPSHTLPATVPRWISPTYPSKAEKILVEMAGLEPASLASLGPLLEVWSLQRKVDFLSSPWFYQHLLKGRVRYGQRSLLSYQQQSLCGGQVRYRRSLLLNRAPFVFGKRQRSGQCTSAGQSTLALRRNTCFLSDTDTWQVHLALQHTSLRSKHGFVDTYQRHHVRPFF